MSFSVLSAVRDSKKSKFSAEITVSGAAAKDVYFFHDSDGNWLRSTVGFPITENKIQMNIKENSTQIRGEYKGAFSVAPIIEGETSDIPSGGGSSGGSSGGGGGSSGGGGSGGSSSGKYKEILERIKKAIEELIKSKACLAGEEGYEGKPVGETIPHSRAQAVLYGISGKTDDLSATTDVSCEILFDDVERDIKNVNFVSLYGLADAFSEHGVFDPETEELTKDLTYTTIRGYFYASLKGMENGDHLSDPVEKVVSGLTETCNAYEDLYKTFVPPVAPPSQDGNAGEQKSKLVLFWDENIADFTAEIEGLWGTLETTGNDFLSFVEMVKEYKTLGTETLQTLSCGANFLNETQSIGCENGYSMLGVHLLSGDSYGNYNETIGKIYAIWKGIREYVPKKDAEEFSKEEKKRNYFNSEILKSVDFFQKSATLKERVVGFVRKYNLI